MRNLSILFAFILFTLPCMSQSFIQDRLSGFSIGNPAFHDLNNDGKVDILGLEQQGFGSVGELAIYINESDLDTITFERSFLNINGIGAPAFADLDGDNDMDIIVSEFDGSASTVVGLFNMGNLEFERTVLSNENVFSHRAADLDNDGDMDFVAFNSDAAEFLNVYFNQGTADFSLDFTYSMEDLRDVELSDMDNDGDIDIVVGLDDFFDSKFILLNNEGNGTFSEREFAESTTGSLADFKIIDFNDDGRNDIVFHASNGFSIRLLQQNASGFFEDMTIISASDRISGFNISDYNSDGSLDVLVGEDDIVFHLNAGTGLLEFNDSEIVSGVSPARHLEEVDLDGDGDLDVVVSNGDFWILENQLEQESTTSTTQQIFNDNIIFPNPFSESIHIENLELGDEIEVYDILGTKITTVSNLSNKINLERLHPGAYIFLVRNKLKGTYTSQMVMKK